MKFIQTRSNCINLLVLPNSHSHPLFSSIYFPIILNVHETYIFWYHPFSISQFIFFAFTSLSLLIFHFPRLRPTKKQPNAHGDLDPPAASSLLLCSNCFEICNAVLHLESNVYKQIFSGILFSQIFKEHRIFMNTSLNMKCLLSISGVLTTIVQNLAMFLNHRMDSVDLT